MLTMFNVSRLASRRVLFPVAATAAAVSTVGLAWNYNRSFVLNEAGKTFKGGDEWIDLKVAKTVDISPDTKHITFYLPNEDDVSGLVTALMLMTKFVTAKGNNVIRPYTPVSDVDQKGTIDFVVKAYPNGKMSQHIHNLKENDTLSFKGPVVKWKWEPNQFKNITLIGGGSGITPLYQLVHEITKNPEDKTNVKLFYGSRSPDDILIKEELDKIAKENKDQVEVHYFVDEAPNGWSEGKTGHITLDVLKEHLPKPSSEHKVFVCGPPPMYNAISGNKKSPTDQGEVTGALAELEYTKDHVFKF